VSSSITQTHHTANMEYSIKINKDVGVDTLHYLGDPLWKLEKIE